MKKKINFEIDCWKIVIKFHTHGAIVWMLVVLKCEKKFPIAGILLD